MTSTPRDGFTLVELLVVVAIVALLMAILLPSLPRARYVTRLAVCASNLRQVAVGSTTYAIAHAGQYPNGPALNPRWWLEGVNNAMMMADGEGVGYHSLSNPHVHNEPCYCEETDHRSAAVAVE